MKCCYPFSTHTNLPFENDTDVPFFYPLSTHSERQFHLFSTQFTTPGVRCIYSFEGVGKKSPIRLPYAGVTLRFRRTQRKRLRRRRIACILSHHKRPRRLRRSPEPLVAFTIIEMFDAEELIECTDARQQQHFGKRVVKNIVTRSWKNSV